METVDIIKECMEKISDADIVLLGFGPEFNIKTSDILDQTPLYKELDIQGMPLDDLEKKWIEYTLVKISIDSIECKIRSEALNIYNSLDEHLRKLNKTNYFVVTTCNDDIIWDSTFDKDRIVAPLGTMDLMKCEKGCFKTVYQTEEVYNHIYYIIQKYKNEDDKTHMYDELKEAMPQCPMCKQVMSANLYKTSNYSAEGYREAWDTYTAWLQKTLNRKLVMIELGEGFETPTVIRWPFEKVAAVNNKSTLIRVNKNFWQIAEDIEGKALPVKMSGKEFVWRLTNG